MKFLILICAVLACAAAKPTGFPYAAPPLAPVTYLYPVPHSLTPAVLPYGAAPAVAPYAMVPAPVSYKTQYFAQDYTGQVSYGYSEPNSAQSSVQDPAGNRVGSFSYVNPNGKLVQTNYVADAGGYRVASNDLPQAPVQQLQPVQDTPEVAEAKANFFAAFEQAKNRQRRAAPESYQTPASTQYADINSLSLAPQPAPALIAAPVHHLVYSAVAPVPYSGVPAAPIAYSALPTPPVSYPYAAYPYLTHVYAPLPAQ